MDTNKTKFLAFMSYARTDDEDNDNYLTGFRIRLSRRVRAFIGEDFPIFQDTEEIDVGQNWAERIEKGLDEVMFLIVILTPSFFNSNYCRKEVERFQKREAILNREDLIIPIHYIPYQKVLAGVATEAKKLADFLAKRHRVEWWKWADLPFDSPKVTAELNNLARQIGAAILDKREELMTQAKARLHQGRWEEARTTAEQTKQQYTNQNAEAVKQANSIVRIANACERFADQLTTAVDRAEQADGNSFDVLNNLVKAANNFEIDVEALRQILGEEISECDHVLGAVQIVKSLNPEDCDQIIGLLEQASSPNLRKLGELLSEGAKAEREAAEEMAKLREIRAKGDWDAAWQIAQTIAVHGRLAGTRQQRAFEREKQLADKLHQAAEAIRSDQFKEALMLLSSISPDEAPSNLELVKRVMEIGTRPEASAEAGNLIAITKLEEELQNLLPAPTGSSSLRVPGEEQVRDKLSYLKGSCLYDEGRLVEAKWHFTGLANKDTTQKKASMQKLELCEKWINSFSQLQSRQWEEAKHLFDSLRREEKSPRAQKWYRWCMWAKKVAPVLELMAAGRWAYDPMLPWEGADSPYKTFASGISPSSTMKQILEFPGSMSQAERASWDALRIIPNRLAVDFSLYAVKDPGRAGALAERVSAIEASSDPLIGNPLADLKYLVAELEEDGGIFLALLGDYDEAIKFFLQEAAARPYEVTILHHLGLAAAAKIHWLEEHAGNNAELAEAWEHLIIGWAPVFADDGFWHNWWITRKAIYQMPAGGQQISSQQIQDVRLRLQRFYLGQLKSVADICPGLDLTFQAEMHGARAVREGDGLPLRDHPDKRAVLGHLGAKALGLLDDVAAWTASFGALDWRAEGWRQRVCRCFSELAKAVTLLDDGRYTDAIAALTNLHLRDANPGFAGFGQAARLLTSNRDELLMQAHCKIALEAVSAFPAEIGKALVHWEAAVDLARRQGQGEDLLKQIRDVAIGRVRFLTLTKEDRRLDALNEAVELLQRVFDKRWDNPEQVIKTALATSLLNRATFLSNKYDDESNARLDAIQACQLTPESLRAIHVLCQTSLYHAKELFMQGQLAHVEALVKDVDQYLAKGDNLFPGADSLNMVREHLNQLRDVITNPTPASLTKLLTDRRSIAEGTEAPPARDKQVEAMIKEAQKDFAAAIELYQEIRLTDSVNMNEVEHRMAYCYRAWINHVLTSDGPPSGDVFRIAQEARRRLPHLIGSDVIIEEMNENLEG